MMSNAIYNDLETTEQETREKRERNAQYSKELHQQLASNQRERQCLYEDKLMENKIREGIYKTIADEDQREIQYQHDHTEEMHKDMVKCLETRQAWKDNQKEMINVEERGIAAQAHVAGDRNAAVVAERDRKIHLRGQHSDILGEKLLADSTARRERENVLLFHQKQECQEKNEQDDIAEQVKMEKYRVEDNKAVSAQLKCHEGAARELASQEAEFTRSAKAQMAAGDKIEHEEERKKKERNHQYSLDLQAQMAGNARHRAVDREREADRNCQQFERYEAPWLAEVEEERQKMMEQHVGDVQHDDMRVERAGDGQESDKPYQFAKCNEQRN